MAGKARLRGQSPAQEALMRPGAKKRGAAAPGPPGPRPPARKRRYEQDMKTLRAPAACESVD